LANQIRPDKTDYETIRITGSSGSTDGDGEHRKEELVTGMGVPGPVYGLITRKNEMGVSSVCNATAPEAHCKSTLYPLATFTSPSSAGGPACHWQLQIQYH